MAPQLNDMQRYLVEEFVEDYKEGHMSRRDMMKRVLGITGTLTGAAAILTAMGCTPSQAPATASPVVTKAAAATSTAPAAVASPAPTTAPAPTATKPAATVLPAATVAAAATVVATTVATVSAQAPRSKYSVPANEPGVNAGDVTYPGQGGTRLMAYLARPQGSGPFAAVLVCHENRGLVEHIRDVTRRLAKAGFVALAPDLLSREGGTAAVDPGQVPGKLSANPDQNVADFRDAFRYLNEQPFVRQGAIGMVGYCYGGGITWRVAVAEPGLKAGVPYYGPTPAAEDVPKINAAILAFYGATDERITATAGPIEEAMKAAGKTFEKMIYPGAGHAFHNDTGNNWNEQAAYDAWERTLAWFKKYLA